MGVEYEVTILTSRAIFDRNHDTSIAIELVGENGESSGLLTLDDFPSLVGSQSANSYHVTCDADVGQPIIVRLKLKNWSPANEWLCDAVVIIGCNSKITTEFPVNDWISADVEVTRGDAFIPQHVTNNDVKRLRLSEVVENRGKFVWIAQQRPTETGWGFPRYVNASTYQQLPKIFQRNEVRANHFVGSGFALGLNSVFQAIGKSYEPVEKLDDFHNLYEHAKLRREKSWTDMDHWNTDESFGRQVFNGMTPHSIKRCTTLPSDIKITNGDAMETIGQYKTLFGEMKAGRVYIVDFREILKGAPRVSHYATGKPLHCPECVAMFYVNDHGQFMPMAIQLGPSRDQVFTPTDNPDDWLLAKMFFRCAQGNVHQWISYYLNTVQVLEPFAVGLFRNFPRSHPIYKLLHPHLRTVAAKNTDARSSFLPTSSILSQGIATAAIPVVRKCYKMFKMSELNVPFVLRINGTTDRQLLPGYYYRDDALAHWKAMEKYVGGVIRHYYMSDANVVRDFELQGWAKDVAKDGLGWQGSDTKGMPEKFSSVQQLIDILVSLIFTSSVQHAAVSMGQFENYKFVPNSPLGMRLPPHKKGEATPQRIMDSLPDVVMAASVIATGYQLTAPSASEKCLGHFPQKLFTEQKIIEIQKSYKRDLEALEAKIAKRNEKLEHPYTYLLPSRVLNSISM